MQKRYVNVTPEAIGANPWLGEVSAWSKNVRLERLTGGADLARAATSIALLLRGTNYRKTVVYGTLEQGNRSLRRRGILIMAHSSEPGSTAEGPPPGLSDKSLQSALVDLLDQQEQGAAPETVDVRKPLGSISLTGVEVRPYYREQKPEEPYEYDIYGLPGEAQARRIVAEQVWLALRLRWPSLLSQHADIDRPEGAVRLASAAAKPRAEQMLATFQAEVGQGLEVEIGQLQCSVPEEGMRAYRGA